MVYEYKTKGTCSSSVTVELSDDGYIQSVGFRGGCNGNTKGIAALATGMKAREAIEKLSGIKCGFKGTSCPDQLAKALQIMLEKQAEG